MALLFRSGAIMMIAAVLAVLDPAAATTLQAATSSSPGQLMERLTKIASTHDDATLEQWVEDLVVHDRFDELGDLFEYLDQVPDLQQVIAAWCGRAPSSPNAWLTQGAFFRGFAWAARGSGWASEVGAENRRLFIQRLHQAKADLEHAAQLRPDDPNASALLIGVALGLGLGKDYVMEQFSLTTRRAPAHYLAHVFMMVYLTPKWYGSLREALSFAATASRQAPLGSRARLLLARAHYNVVSGEHTWEYLQRSDVWQEIETAFTEYLEQNPNDLRMRNYFLKYAYEAGRTEIARQQLTAIGEDWDRPCWGSRKYFDDARHRLSLLKTGQ